MQTAVPTAVIARFVEAIKKDPDRTVALIDAGRADELNVYVVTAEVVNILAQSVAQYGDPVNV